MCIRKGSTLSFLYSTLRRHACIAFWVLGGPQGPSHGKTKRYWAKIITYFKEERRRRPSLDALTVAAGRGADRKQQRRVLSQRALSQQEPSEKCSGQSSGRGGNSG